MRQGKLVLIIGPSGVGKSVVLQALRERHASFGLSTGSAFHFPRSATTRLRRPGEGDDLYVFISDAEFDRFLSEEKLLEWAKVHEGARYGTLLQEIIPAIEKGKVVVREVDVQGFDSIRRHTLFHGDKAPYLLESIFLLPESKEQLIEHITKRAPISDQELQKRMQSMEKEFSYAELCDHQVVNAEGELERTVEALERLIVGG